MHSKAVIQCPACKDAGWHFNEATYVRALLEEDEANLIARIGGAEGLVRQLRVRGALRCRDDRHQGVVGQEQRSLAL
jgi:hypothetical protein